MKYLLISTLIGGKYHDFDRGDEVLHLIFTYLRGGFLLFVLLINFYLNVRVRDVYGMKSLTYEPEVERIRGRMQDYGLQDLVIEKQLLRHTKVMFSF